MDKAPKTSYPILSAFSEFLGDPACLAVRMKLTLHRIPRLRALVLFLIGFLSVIIIIGLKMCHDKYRLYQEFESLKKLERTVDLLEREIQALESSASQLNSRLEDFNRKGS